jgi:hypothetical protein
VFTVLVGSKKNTTEVVPATGDEVLFIAIVQNGILGQFLLIW